MIKLLLVIIVLGLGLYFIAMNCRTINVENFDSENEITERCPNMLIEHENMYFLYIHLYMCTPVHIFIY